MNILSIPFFPEQASEFAGPIDALYFVLIGLSVFFTVLIAGLIVYFAIKYRQGAQVDRTLKSPDNTKLEITWTVIPTILALTVFVWAAVLFFNMSRPPEDGLELFVVGKQWMWKIQHPEGNREINTMHIPVGVPIKLTMTSEDVIHAFSIPAFRVKRDVLPGRYTTQWFTATRPGEFHLFCAEYCGTEHSMMVGTVYALEQDEYEDWLAGEIADLTPEEAGARHYQRYGCATCHDPGTAIEAPPMEGLFNSEVELDDGTVVIADEEYLRDSILNPLQTTVAGYQPGIMPTFAGRLSEQEVRDIIAYIRSLGDAEQPEE